ncbi:hypothetical protein LguiA_036405 [Lonicera macranthoides]
MTENNPMEEGIQNDLKLVPDSEIARIRLRQRWELASVLHFLKVFEPVIGNNLKISAEEIETALIYPNNSLAQLHIMLLKGIPPVSKTLNVPDAWVTAVSKKLAMWWPWVAEGDFPLAAAKGEEKSRYKELDPTIRLIILKALCEIRADQDDTVSYINESIKKGTEVSNFRKDKIGEDGKGTAYWYDGDAIIGHRLYKEVNKFESKPKIKGKGTMPAINSKWETLATNLEEFRKVTDEFSSSELELEVVVSKAVETDAIPALEKLQKKKQRAIKQQQRQEMLLNGFRTSGVTRSCRNRRPVTYTFDEYDRAIDDAIKQTKQIWQKRKTTQERLRAEKPIDNRKQNGSSSNMGSDPDSKSREGSTTGSETQSDNSRHQDQDGDDVVDDTSDDQYEEDKGDNDNSNEIVSDTSSSDKESDDHTRVQPKKEVGPITHKPRGSRWSKRVAGNGDVAHPVPENRNLGAKNRLRQRPQRNTALESAVAPDTEDDENSSAEDTSNSSQGHENSSQSSDHEEDESDS